jgi:hypothetical protein
MGKPQDASNRPASGGSLAGMIGGGTWEGATHVWHETP